WKVPAKKSHQRSHDARTHNGDAVGWPGRRVPYGIERGFHVGGKHSSLWRQSLRQFCDGACGDVENALVRIERKDQFAPQSLGAALDPSDCGIAILYRKGKIARHEGGAHPIKLGSGYFPTKY